MNRKKKKYIIILLSILIFIGMLLCFAQWHAKSMVEDFLARKIPPHLELKYDDLDINILRGNVDFSKVHLEIKNEDSLVTYTTLQLEKLQLNGFGYMQLLFNNSIVLDELKVQRSAVNFYPYKKIEQKESESKGLVKLLKTILVKKLEIEDSSMHIMKDAADSIQVSIANYNLDFHSLKTDSDVVTRKIPVEYDSYEINASEIFVDLGKYETLQVANLFTSETELQIKDVHLSTKYSTKELSQLLVVERDHVDLQIPHVNLSDLNFGFKENRFEITASSLLFEQPHAEIYRDKLVADDMRIKPLYGRLLRKLPITIFVEQLKIENGYLSYEEKIAKEQHAGKLFFDELNAELNNVTNFEDAEDTKIHATAKLIGQADLKLDWTFNVNNSSDAFTASGELLNLEAEKLNAFLEPNLRVRTKGFVDEMYFTISGNSVSSQGDMKMKYQDFKFNILNKDRLKINKFLTVIGNVFVNDGSKTDRNGYRFGSIEVDRETNKSFYNYLWLNVSDGMVSTLTGNGKKE
ncbi:hypothetical protein JQC67_00435 [Aurantibacter crassamenti]|uniref:hypothetical protein n=1 Tax=Aurantibacter crassamenti TaxID=1837375 RepID=UPI00193A8CF0|nr:hypothetical protein [Aurantibacter crassamenti]MBM1104591.1 hypothetical protein [Aurantibacter crassamenti]